MAKTWKKDTRSDKRCQVLATTKKYKNLPKPMFYVTIIFKSGPFGH